MLVLPPDACKLEKEEADSLLARVQGDWSRVLVSGQPAGCCSFMNDERMEGAVYTVNLDGRDGNHAVLRFLRI